jgi:hypothetical protein
LKLFLRYQTVRCSRCDITRQTRFPCPDCGKAPAVTEIDLHVERRRRAVRQAKEARRQRAAAPALDARALLRDGELDTLPTRVLRAARKVAEEHPDGAAELAGLGRDISSLEAWTRETRELRPNISVTRAMKSAVRGVVAIYDVVVQALSAEQLSEVQHANRSIQEALEASRRALGRVEEILSLTNSVLESDDPVATWLAESIQGNPVAAAERGKALFENRVGHDCGGATALGALTLDSMAASVGDQAHFWHLVKEHVSVLRGAGDSLRSIAADPSYRSRAAEVTHDLWWAARRAVQSPDPETLRAAATELLESGHLMVEQAMKFHLGIACAVTTRMTFADTQARDVSELANIAVDQGWVVSTSVGSSDLRNAFAHRDYRLTHDQLFLSPARRQRRCQPNLSLSLEEAQDAVLGFVEVNAAMGLAWMAVAEELSIEEVILPAAAYLARTWLLALGWSDVTVEEEEDVVVIEACTEGSIPFSATAFFAQPFVGTGIALLTIRLRRMGASRRAVIDMPLQAYERWAHSDDAFHREVAFIELGARTHIDGSPLISRIHVEKYAAFRACQAVADRSRPFADVNAELKAWRGMARSMGMDGLQRLLGRAQRWRATAGANMPVDAAEMDPLTSLASTEVDLLPTALL